MRWHVCVDIFIQLLYTCVLFYALYRITWGRKINEDFRQIFPSHSFIKTPFPSLFWVSSPYHFIKNDKFKPTWRSLNFFHSPCDKPKKPKTSYQQVKLWYYFFDNVSPYPTSTPPPAILFLKNHLFPTFLKLGTGEYLISRWKFCFESSFYAVGRPFCLSLDMWKRKKLYLR